MIQNRHASAAEPTASIQAAQYDGTQQFSRILKQSYSRLAKRILQDCPSASQLAVFTDDKKQDEVVAAVKRWLEHAKNTQWLMVFDNYDNPKVPGNADPGAVDIRQFLPEAHHGSVIVTTRSSKVSMGHRVKVGKLEDVRDSLQILSEMTLSACLSATYNSDAFFQK